MKKNLMFVFVCLLTVSVIGDIINIAVSQEVSLMDNGAENSNFNTSNLVWVGNNSLRNDAQGMFGFDMSPLTSLLGAGETLTINNMSMFAYPDYVDEDGIVDIALGNSDVWNGSVVTWNTSNSDHGAIIDSINITTAQADSYVSWDISSVAVSEFITDNYLTFYLSIPDLGVDNWKVFKGNDTEDAYLTIDYTINTPGPTCINPPAYDFDGDCIVGLTDFAMFTGGWLDCGLDFGCP